METKQNAFLIIKCMMILSAVYFYAQFSSVFMFFYVHVNECLMKTYIIMI